MQRTQDYLKSRTGKNRFEHKANLQKNMKGTSEGNCSENRKTPRITRAKERQR